MKDSRGHIVRDAVRGRYSIVRIMSDPIAICQLQPLDSPDAVRHSRNIQTALEMEEGVVMEDLDLFDGRLVVWLRRRGVPGVAVAPIDGGLMPDRRSDTALRITRVNRPHHG